MLSSLLVKRQIYTQLIVGKHFDYVERIQKVSQLWRVFCELPGPTAPCELEHLA